jgi:serralysin
VSKPAVRPVMAVAVAVVAATGLSVGPAFATVASASHSVAVGRTQVWSKAISSAPPGTNAGPPYSFTTELMGQVPLPSFGLKDRMWITRTDLGYRLWSGQQNSHLTITIVNGKLRFRDTGTKELPQLSSRCTKQRVRVGVSATCRIPGGISAAHPLLIEVWPRLGNDYTDSSTLPASFAVTMLGDEGNDVAKFGAGRDFFNGHLGRDRVWGGSGNDWIRGGGGNDWIDAGSGADDIVGMENNDTVLGGPGNDRIWTGPGGDDLVGGTGADLLVCGSGADSTTDDPTDQVSRTCESNSMVTRQRPRASIM